MSGMNMKTPLLQRCSRMRNFKIMLKICHLIGLTFLLISKFIHKKSPFLQNLHFVSRIGTIIQISEEKGNFF